MINYSCPFINFWLWTSFLGGTWQTNQVTALSGTRDKLSHVSESAETSLLTGLISSDNGNYIPNNARQAGLYHNIPYHHLICCKHNSGILSVPPFQVPCIHHHNVLYMYLQYVLHSIYNPGIHHEP